MSNLAGDSLVEARLQSGLDPQTIASRIHITAQQYLALERGDYQRLRGDVFVRGYLRTCAAILNLDPAVLLQLYSQDVANQQELATKHEQFEKLVAVASLKRSSPISGWLLLLFFCTALIAALIKWRAVDSTVDASHLDAPVAEHSEGADQIIATETLSSESSVAPDPSLTPDVTPAEVTPTQDAPVAEALPQTITSVTSDTSSHLYITFSHNCWLRVSDSNKEIFQGEKNSDAPLDVTGTPPFDVTLGNVSAVSKVELNGEPISITPEAGKNKLRLLIPAVAKGAQQ